MLGYLTSYILVYLGFVWVEHARERGITSISRAIAAIAATPTGQKERGVGRMFDYDGNADTVSQTVQTHQVRRSYFKLF